jgi:Sigma-70, region 4
VAWRELQALLDEELNRLPQKYRAPFVLCCLEGKSKKEAADELRWKEGTVSSRLAAARKLLQQRLARRGVTLSTVLCGAAVAQDSASAAVPASLAAGSVAAAIAFARGIRPAAGTVSAEAIALAKQMLQAMAASRFKFGVALLLLLAAAGAGAGTLLRQRVAQQPDALARLDAPPDAARDGNRRSEPAPAPARTKGLDQTGDERGSEITVAGQVGDVNGQPLPGAEVAVVTAGLGQPGDFDPPARLERKLLASDHADDRGEFQLSTRDASPQGKYVVALIVARPGYALDAHLLTPGQTQNQFVCRLHAGHAVHGRILDARGNPASHVEVHVASLHPKGQAANVLRFLAPAVGLRPWPAPVTTDDQGDFLLRDAGPDQEIELQIRDERFAPQWLVLPTGAEENAKPLTFVLAPRRRLEGTVTCMDTGEPMPGAQVDVQSQGVGAASLLPNWVQVQTDDKGRFQIAPFPGQQLVIAAHAPREMPYLGIQSQTFRWPAGAARHQVRVTLPRGVRLRGRVVEAASGRPVPGATVEYRPRFADNRFLHWGESGAVTDWWSQVARSGPDGSFQYTVLPGPGWLVVKGPGAEYIHTEITARQLECGKRGGMPYFFDAVIPLDLKPTADPEEIAATLRLGVTVIGRVLGRDGRPAASALLLSPTYIPSGSTLQGEALPTRDGRYELPGCDPGKSVRVLFFDPQRLEGALVELPSHGTGESGTVHLEPCGTATVRFLGGDGKPARPRNLSLDIVLRPGAAIQESIDQEREPYLAVPAQRLGGYQCVSLDVQAGTATFANLVPRATYVVQLDSGQGFVPGAFFTVQTGEKVQLQDIILKPQGPRMRKP